MMEWKNDRMEKWWKVVDNDGKMIEIIGNDGMEKWWKHDGHIMGNDGKIMAKLLEMMEKWWANDGKMKGMIGNDGMEKLWEKHLERWWIKWWEKW